MYRAISEKVFDAQNGNCDKCQNYNSNDPEVCNSIDCYKTLPPCLTWEQIEKVLDDLRKENNDQCPDDDFDASSMGGYGLCIFDVKQALKKLMEAQQ